MEGSSSNYFLIVLLTLLVFSSCLNLSSAGRVGPATNTEFIRTSCKTTTYPQLCFTSLSVHANAIQTSPKLLAHTALSLTLDTTKSMSAMMVRLSQSHNMKPKEVAAMRDCIEVISDAVDQLQNSLGEMSQLRGSNFDLMINDIQTWVSAALTNDDTCMDGFDGNAMNGNVKNAVRGRIVNIAHITSNALALINNFAALQD